MLHGPFVSNMVHINATGVITSVLLLILSTISLHLSSIIRHYLNSYTLLNSNKSHPFMLLVVFTLHLLDILITINSISVLADLCLLVSPWTRRLIAFLIYQLIKSPIVEILFSGKYFSSSRLIFDFQYEYESSYHSVVLTW